MFHPPRLSRVHQLVSYLEDRSVKGPLKAYMFTDDEGQMQIIHDQEVYFAKQTVILASSLVDAIPKALRINRDYGYQLELRVERYLENGLTLEVAFGNVLADIRTDNVEGFSLLGPYDLVQ